MREHSYYYDPLNVDRLHIKCESCGLEFDYSRFESCYCPRCGKFLTNLKREKEKYFRYLSEIVNRQMQKLEEFKQDLKQEYGTGNDYIDDGIFKECLSEEYPFCDSVTFYRFIYKFSKRAEEIGGRINGSKENKSESIQVQVLE